MINLLSFCRFIFLVSACFWTVLTTAAAQPVATKEIRIGVAIPLTGGLAHAGADIRNGMELGIKEFSTSQLKFVALYEDTAYEAAKTLSAVNKLLTLDKVDVLVTLWDTADPVAPIADRAKIPHIAIRWNPHITEQHPFTLTIESTYLTYADKLLGLVTLAHARRVSLIGEDTQGCILLRQQLASVAPAKGIEIVANEGVPPGDADIRPSILRAIKNKPDLVITVSDPPKTDQIIRRLKELAPHQRYTGYFEIMDDTSMVEGVPFTAMFKVAPWFEERFIKLYGHPIKARAPHAYDIIKLLSLAYQSKPTKLASNEVVRYLSAIHNVSGASGTLRVTSTRTIENDPVYKVRRHGAFVEISDTEVAAIEEKMAQ